jgi:ferric-dicitrate binding protein FerR (iron transport regulator)
MKLSDKNRINTYFLGETGDDEDFVSAAYLNPENEFELKEIARKHWVASSGNFIDLQHILNHIHFMIRTGKKQSFRTRMINIYYRVAAVFMIPVIFGGVYLLAFRSSPENTFTEIRAPKGSRIQFTLPDGSTGSLNGGSQMRYSDHFKRNRKLFLTGEGYFKVMKDEKHPFVVSTEYVDVQALGTRFDVCAYPEDQDVYTTLDEGSVRILNKAVNISMTLVPGEQNVCRTPNGEMENRKVRTDLYTSWKDELLRFDNALFDEVVKKMERWYGVKIVVDKRLKYSENYTFTIKTESLRELLGLLSYTTPMTFKIDKDSVMIYPLYHKK